jgi:hypothetical protein
MGLWRSRVICILNVPFLCKKSNSVSASYSLINKRIGKVLQILLKGFYFSKANSIGGNNMAAPIYIGAIEIFFMNRQHGYKQLRFC